MQTEPILIRPSLAAYFGRALTAPLNTYIVIVALVLGIAVSGLAGSVTFWTAAVVGLSTEVVRLSLSLSRERVEYQGGAYRVRASDGRWKSFAAAQISEVIAVRASGRRGDQAPISRLYARSRSTGDRLFRLSGSIWRGADLVALAEDLRSHGVAVESLSERTALDTLSKKHPWALDRWEARARTIFLVLALVLVGALAVERFLS